MTGIGVRPAVAADGFGHLRCLRRQDALSDCERIKVRLTLFARPDRGTPTGYLLERICVGNGDQRTVDEGGWQTTTGSPTDADAVVVILNPTAPNEFRRFQRVGDNILLMLDDRGLPRVGDARHNFTLSRTA